MMINKISKIIGKGKPIFGGIKMRRDEISELFPNTRKVKKDFDIVGSDELNSINFPSLEIVGGNFSVLGNKALKASTATIQFNVLTDAGITGQKEIQSPIGGVTSSPDNPDFTSIQAIINKIGNDAGTFVIKPK